MPAGAQPPFRLTIDANSMLPHPSYTIVQQRPPIATAPFHSFAKKSHYGTLKELEVHVRIASTTCTLTLFPGRASYSTTRPPTSDSQRQATTAFDFLSLAPPSKKEPTSRSLRIHDVRQILIGIANHIRFVRSYFQLACPVPAKSPRILDTAGPYLLIDPVVPTVQTP